MNGGHFKLGLFVTIGAVLLVVFLLTLGVLDRFRPSVLAETYFSEPVLGLQPGAAVRFRGMQVGTVGRIEFASNTYEEAFDPGSKPIDGLIRVTMDLSEGVFKRHDVEDPRDWLEADDVVGLRVRLSSAGLGGPTFIGMDFMDPVQFPRPTLGWEPEGAFIPSAPSTAGTIIGSLESILRSLDEADFVRKLSEFGPKISDGLDELTALLEELRTTVEKLENAEVLTSANDAMQELQLASADVREMLADERLDDLIDEASATLEGARTLLVDDRETIDTMIADLTQMANQLGGTARALDEFAKTINDSGAVERLATLADDLGPAGRDLADLAARLQRLIGENDTQIADTIRALRDASLELEALLEELKANPGRVLSDPPPRGTPGGGG